MTRFARAEGSKSSNKREYEEATPWEEMKKDMMIQKKKKKKNKDNNEEIKSSLLSCTVKKLSVSPTNAKDVTSSDSINNEQNEIKKHSRANETMQTNLISNYKILISSTKTEVVSSDNIINNEKNKINKDGKKKNKKKSLSLEEKKKNWVIEDGRKYKVFKNGIKKPWFDLAYEENDVMTRYNSFFIKVEDVKQLNQFKKSLEEQNLSQKEIGKKLFYKESKLHNKLRVELLKKEVSRNKEVRKPETNVRSKKNVNVKFTKKSEKMTKQKYAPKYEENEVMTSFEGFWILRKNLQHLQRVAEIKLQRIINNRTDDNRDKNLTSDEELMYRRLMKKEKRREFNLLQTYLKENRLNKNAFQMQSQSRAGANTQWQNTKNESIVKFDGYNVQKEGAERLQNLKETLLAKGCTEEEITEVMKTERRKEERVLKRSNNSFCFQCRQPGHMVSFCPQNGKEGKSNHFDICFRCGSAEHTAKNCKSRSHSSSSSAYPLATCFICNEVGHISRECPDNPKGLYPNGGCCNLCGSVEHLRRDCPELQEKKAEETLTVSVFRRGDQVEEIGDEFQNRLPFPSEGKKKPKIIKFD